MEMEMNMKGKIDQLARINMKFPEAHNKIQPA